MHLILAMVLNLCLQFGGVGTTSETWSPVQVQIDAGELAETRLSQKKTRKVRKTKKKGTRRPVVKKQKKTVGGFFAFITPAFLGALIILGFFFKNKQRMAWAAPSTSGYSPRKAHAAGPRKLNMLGGDPMASDDDDDDDEIVLDQPASVGPMDDATQAAVLQGKTLDPVHLTSAGIRLAKLDKSPRKKSSAPTLALPPELEGRVQGMKGERVVYVAYFNALMETDGIMTITNRRVIVLQEIKHPRFLPPGVKSESHLHQYPLVGVEGTGDIRFRGYGFLLASIPTFWWFPIGSLISAACLLGHAFVRRTDVQIQAAGILRAYPIARGEQQKVLSVIESLRAQRKAAKRNKQKNARKDVS